jgi:GT2 family glycosyltransferase
LNKKVAILLVLYNEEKHIERLAKSIYNQSYKEISVYALDNNSTDSSVSLLLTHYPKTNINRSAENHGFAKANNIIALKAINNDEELLFILNTDMELERDCIKNLVESIAEMDDVAGVTPLIYFGSGEGRTNNIQCFADKVNFRNARTRTLYSGTNVDYDEIPRILYVNSVHGGCFMIRSSVVTEIGLFNEDNFMYNDEIDLAYRIKKRNLKLLAVKDAKAWHFHDWTKKNKYGYYLQYYYMNRNRFLFFYRYKKYFSFFREVLLEILLFPVKINWAKKTAGLKLLKYYYLGCWHGLLNRKGRADIEFR